MEKLGFGFLRLPRLDAADETSIDYELLNQMVDSFLEKGGVYFDTAYTYLGGASEDAICKSVVQRHPRQAFKLADKLPTWKIKRHEDCRKYFDEQLGRCGVTYFDCYLLHWLNQAHYAICKQHDIFAFLRQIKAEGVAKKIGFSYHDSAQLLDQILTEQPDVDYVQLQINYLDWDSASIQAAQCYAVAVKHNKEVIVMEPVKGGNLVTLPESAQALLRQLQPGESMAAWAIRFAQSLEQVHIVLSGMNALEQMAENMRPMEPLTEEERQALAKVAQIIRADTAVACTGCNYCGPNCPKNIPIPRIFSLYNDYARNTGEGWKMQPVYHAMTRDTGKASSCIGCKQCERNCPQKLEITAYLKQATQAFEA